MNRRWLACSLLGSLGLLFMACASDTTDPDARSAEQSVEQEAQPNAEIPADGEAAGAAPTRDLGQLERELADNRAKLRQLGVAIDTTTVDGEPEPDPAETKPVEPAMEEEKTKTTSRNKDRKTGGKAKQDKKATTGGVTPSQAKPGSASGGSSGSITEGDAVAEPAKSVQAPPTVRPTEQNEEERCPLICSLADGTCELTDEICELADRHDDDDAYLLACERASTDCKQAREACLECLG